MNCEHSFSLVINVDLESKGQVTKNASCDKCQAMFPLSVVFYSLNRPFTDSLSQNTCGKVAFKSKKDALTRLNSIREQTHATNKFPKRAYPCDTCNSWHLTSHA